LIQDVLKVNPHAILLINTGNPVDMRAWVDKIPSLIYAWYPGEQGGDAFADILFGQYNPSGRLPISMMKRWEDAPEFGTYPETDGAVNYKEGIFVGYRYYDKSKVDPMFAFGHGLSYSQFEYTNLEVKTSDSSPDHPDIDVSVTVTNTSKTPGAEVVQLYVRDLAPQVERPMQELKGFQRVMLKAGESQVVKMKLDKLSFAYYDTGIHDWKARPGQYTLRIGASSRDIRLEGGVELGKSSEKVASDE